MFHCACSKCFLDEALKLEQKKKYREAENVYDASIQYFSQELQRMQNEREKFRTRRIQESSNQPFQSTELSFQTSIIKKNEVSSRTNNLCGSVNIPSNKQYSYSKAYNSDKEKEIFKCPIAMFNEVEDPFKKPMYNKNQVYNNGNDIQLEELRALWYNEKTKSENIEPLIDTTSMTEIQKKNESIRIPLGEITGDLLNENENNRIILAELTTEIKNEKENKQKSLAENQNENEEFLNSMLNQMWSSPVCKPSSDFNNSLKNESVTLRTKLRRKDDLQSYLIHSVNNNQDEEEKEETEVKAFSMTLPSSTPFQRRRAQNFNDSSFIETKANTEINCAESSKPAVVAPADQNLSMILELSKERSTSSNGSNGNNNVGIISKSCIANEKTINENNLPVIVEMSEKTDSILVKKSNKNMSVNSQTYVIADNITNIESNGITSIQNKLSFSKFDDLSDPFDETLIQYFLQCIKFPKVEHSGGYHLYSSNMPVLKQFVSIKLGNEEYEISGKIGEGSYARIFKANQKSKNNKIVVLKQQKPAWSWEFYISKEIRKRLNSSDKKQFFVDYSDLFVFRNGSILLSEWGAYGSVLNLVSNLRTSNTQGLNGRCPTAVVLFLSVQLISAIEYLHSCQIIHGDVKPDNFIIHSSIKNLEPCIQLIDYGRSIDMTLYPEGTVFYKVVETEDFSCKEMKENKPWTYQTDLYGLAGTIYVLLMGEYMKLIKRNNEWIFQKPLFRYMNKELWNPIFEGLLNIPSCTELPNLLQYKLTLQEFFSKMDKYTIRQQFSIILSTLKKHQN